MPPTKLTIAAEMIFCELVAKSTRLAPDGRRVVVDDAPLLDHAVGDELHAQREIFEEYRRAGGRDPAVAIRVRGLARRVTGVGSVGTRCFVVLLSDPLGQSLVLQVVPDVFLGHVRFDGRDFHLRRFRDVKATISIPSLTTAQFVDSVRGCAVVLARAHAQSPRAAEVAGYLGASTKGENAFLSWCLAYAAQSADDYRAFCESVSVARH